MAEASSEAKRGGPRRVVRSGGRPVNEVLGRSSPGRLRTSARYCLEHDRDLPRRRQLARTPSPTIVVCL
jgi:hypothetical protein